MNDKLKELSKTANQIGEIDKTLVTLKDGKEVEIYKCKAKHVGVVLEFVAFVMEQMNVNTLSEAAETSSLEMKTMLKMLSKSADRLFITAAYLCSLSYEELADLELDDALSVVKGVFEVNKPFFINNVLPHVQSGSLTLQGQESKS